jgi:hypothetical protein
VGRATEVWEDANERRSEVSAVKKEVGQTETEPDEITEVNQRVAEWKVTETEQNRI